MDEDIDESWIKEFKRQESDYNDFYKEETRSIKLFFLYVSGTNILDYVKSDTLILEQSGIVPKNQIVSLIKRNQCNNNLRYKLLSLLKFNIDIEPRDISSFVEGGEDNDFTTSEKYLDDIRFTDTICILQDLNSLFFVFYEQDNNVPHSTTRTIRLRSNARRTRRKRT